jgi:viroplasmin and RNaseH domain-containing protein
MAMSTEMPRCYVVYKGWVPGVYDEWEDCQKQVNKFSGNSYKGNPTRELAKARWRIHLLGERRNNNRMKTLMIVLPVLLTIAGVVYSVFW